MKTKFQKFIAAILAVLMIISAFPVTSYAAEGDIGLIKLKAKNIDVSHPFKYGHEIHYTTIDGKSYPLFCINKGKKSPNTAAGTKKGDGFTPSKAQKEAAKWIYAGYYLEHGDSVDELDMACCQKKFGKRWDKHIKIWQKALLFPKMGIKNGKVMLEKI